MIVFTSTRDEDADEDAEDEDAADEDGDEELKTSSY